MHSSIEVTDLRKRFGTTVALDGITFTVRPGQVTGFVGPNGAGKSTTMRVILGLDSADEGIALVNGQPYRRSATSPACRSAAGRRCLASGPHRPQPLALAGPFAGSESPAGGRGARPDRLGLGRSTQGGRLFARHAATTRHRRRHARRPAGTDAGRTIQWTRSRGHHLDARAATWPGRRGAGDPGVQPPHGRVAGHRVPS